MRARSVQRPGKQRHELDQYDGSSVPIQNPNSNQMALVVTEHVGARKMRNRVIPQLHPVQDSPFLKPDLSY